MDVNVTVWSVEYAIPYHAANLYENYKVGYSIISLQAKEAKYSGIKNDLDLTNRSHAASDKGKWQKVMRANYVRAFYLSEHEPMPNSYTSPYKSCLPSHINAEIFCSCGRAKEMCDDTCMVCADARVIVECAKKEKRLLEVVEMLKPVLCSECNERFPDTVSCQAHQRCIQERDSNTNNSDGANCEHKKELQSRPLSTTGNKKILIRRLEGALTKEVN